MIHAISRNLQGGSTMTIVKIRFGALLWMLIWSGTGLAVAPGSPGDVQVTPPGDNTQRQAVPPATHPNMYVNRGELLYENHCQGCHQSTVHVRGHRRADSVEAIQGWVRRWAEDRELGWDDEAIRAVTDYLNRRYYKIGSPEKK
jgi:mono/diheme cytochrome c family protein